MFKWLALIFSAAIAALVVANGTAPRPPAQEPTSPWRHELNDARRWSREGDLYRASNRYAEIARRAAGRDDWQALIAVAREVRQLSVLQAPGLDTYTLLVRAMVAAEKRRSPDGLRAVAAAFRSAGETYAALALSRIAERPSDKKPTAESSEP